MFSLKVMVIGAVNEKLTALFTGLVLVTVGGIVTLNMQLLSASGLPARSVTEPVCNIRVYLDSARALVGVMVNTLPLMELVKGTSLPALLSSIQSVPFWMFSENVTLITLFEGTFIALFWGSVLVIVGGVVSTVKVKLLSASGLPARSVTEPVCNITVYLD